VVVPPDVAPSPVSLLPVSGTGSSRTFTFQFSHPGGSAMIAAAAIRLAGADGQDCTLYYIFSASSAYMMNDNDTVWMGPVQMGSASPLQNSRCIVDTAGTSISSTGTTLTLNVPFTFRSQFAGTRSVSVQLTGTNGKYTGLVVMGSWTVPASSVPPSPLSLSPSSGAGATQSFIFQFTHPEGAGMVAAAAV
jgi:hypothetical protein